MLALFLINSIIIMLTELDGKFNPKIMKKLNWES